MKPIPSILFRIACAFSLCFLFNTFAYAQFSVGVSGVLFNHLGSAAANSTVRTVKSGDQAYFVANPFSVKTTASYGFFMQLQGHNSADVVTGLKIGYDKIKSENTNVIIPDPVSPSRGSDYFNNDYFNLNPYLGRHFEFNQLAVELTVGAEAAFAVQSTETFKAGTTGAPINQTASRGRFTDWRVKPALALTYKRVGLDFSYARGLTNLNKSSVTSIEGGAYSQLFRLGLSYALN
ncbi:hypothetical protein MUY27_10250 [Mucilaginibacter sp. RS28]|uniref:Outer membrane protein beta-barrel domain-containing protein n=1 Tax=Mucilaginibacter straminoryzae TaxID=2932774 RepID=A0A9X2B9T6_9SPHI|nr:hypothetical protein [Mucilaginibacter straminoryzae]MCJ8210090.1 hypothetical protein [Mucilaginibacter straminoryzae]